MDYYYKYIKYRQKYLSLKYAFVQSDTSDRILGGKRISKKNKRNIYNQLEITVLKQGTKSDKVLSCSYFTMKEAYRIVEKYQNNLKRFIETKKQLKGFETRIYTDDSGKEYALEVAKNDPTVSVYYFNFPPLKEENAHIGTFGTYVRFMPLFEKGLKIVWVSDIDIPNHYLDPSIISNAQQSNADFCYRTYVCYERKLYGRIYSILAGTMMSFITFPEEIFNNFLNELVYPSNKFLNNLEGLNKANQLKGKPYSKIPYGFDEIFTNQIIYNYLIKKSLKCYILKDYINAGKYLQYNKLISREEDKILFIYYHDPSDDLFQKIKKMFKEKLPLLTEHECLQDMLKIFDSFKSSLVLPIIRKGKELDEKI